MNYESAVYEGGNEFGDYVIVPKFIPTFIHMH